MQEANIGDLHLSFDGKRLAVAGLNAEQAQASLDGSEIEQLYRFLGSIVGISPNQRQSFRLGARALMDLGVTLVRKGRMFGATAQDLSVTGISLQLNDEEVLNIPQLEEIEVVLELGDQTLTHTAIVRRQIGKAYGLFFPASMKGEHIEPSAELVALLLELQRRSLMKMVDTKSAYP